MEGKGKYIFPVLMTGIIVFIVSFLVSLINIGLPPDFIARWLGAFLLAWPLAAVVAFFAIPLARFATQRIVALIEPKA